MVKMTLNEITSILKLALVTIFGIIMLGALGIDYSPLLTIFNIYMFAIGIIGLIGFIILLRRLFSDSSRGGA
jgi:preprotein translocase subunit Sss1